MLKTYCSPTQNANNMDNMAHNDVTMMRSVIACFEISFDREGARFYEGEDIRGKVVLDLNDDIIIETLTLDFSGSAMVEWLKRQRDSNNHQNEVEKHLNQILTLYARGNNSDIVVAAGRHDYHFRIQLPYNLPSSFAGKHGNIKYKVKAVIDRPWQSAVTVQRDFTVISVVDLNQLPQLWAPRNCHKASEPRVCCLGPVVSRDNFLTVWRLDRTGYVPGEKIRINGEIHNNGKTKIRKTTAALIQHVQYLDIWGHTLLDKKRVCHMEKGTIHSGHIGFWREEMEVPTLPPSGLRGCSMINLWYTLNLKVLPSGISKPLETLLDITIGTVPIATNTAGYISVLSGSLMHGGSETQLDTLDDFNYFV